MTRIALPAALLAATCALGACSMAPASSSSLASTGYHPKYLPAADVIAASEKSGKFGGATYICGDRDCATAIRAD
ncbi:hypothetical protein [Asticcacaulis solisilvae]|uniref:hypothetical protein n=1 Tax=Asticcacaulis solisilvae TaxID=1217274 RepID=UPI003FD7327D